MGGSSYIDPKQANRSTLRAKIGPQVAPGATGYNPRIFLWGLQPSIFLQSPGFPSVRASVAAKNVLPQRAVHAPIGVHHLGDAEIGTYRHQRDRFILAHPM